MSNQQADHPIQSNNNNPIIQSSLKKLLENILLYFEKFTKNQDNLTVLQKTLNDYYDIPDLIDIIKDAFTELTKKIDSKLRTQDSKNVSLSSSNDVENYDELEKIVQKYEEILNGDGRLHKIEQQMKLYAESLQSKLEDSEKTRSELLESTKSIINSLKRDNQKLVENIKVLKEENEKLITKLKMQDDANKQYNDKLSNINHLEGKVKTLEKIIQETKSSKSHFKDIQGATNNIPTANKESTTNRKKASNPEVDNQKLAKKNEFTNTSNNGFRTNNSNIMASPAKEPRKTLYNSGFATSASSKNNEFLKAKLDIMENNNNNTNIHYNHKDSTPDLKASFQKIIPSQKTRDSRQASSVMKTRDNNTNNNRGVFTNVHIGQNMNTSLHPGSFSNDKTYHKRSTSNTSQQKRRPSVSKSNYDISSILILGETNNEDRLASKNEKRPKAL